MSIIISLVTSAGTTATLLVMIVMIMFMIIVGMASFSLCTTRMMIAMVWLLKLFIFFIILSCGDYLCDCDYCCYFWCSCLLVGNFNIQIQNVLGQACKLIRQIGRIRQAVR